MEEKQLKVFSKLVKEINSLIVQGYGSFNISVDKPTEAMGFDLTISAAHSYSKNRRMIMTNFENQRDVTDIMSMIKQHEFKIF